MMRIWITLQKRRMQSTDLSSYHVPESLQVVASLRFDDGQTRQERKTTDKAAPISEIFYKVILNSQAVYRPSPYFKVDEMLVTFRGRCSFRMLQFR